MIQPDSGDDRIGTLHVMLEFKPELMFENDEGDDDHVNGLYAINTLDDLYALFNHARDQWCSFIARRASELHLQHKAERDNAVAAAEDERLQRVVDQREHAAAIEQLKAEHAEELERVKEGRAQALNRANQKR